MSGHELAGVLGSSRMGLKVLYMSGYPQSHVSRQGLIGPGDGLHSEAVHQRGA